jgi:glycosyltransferase involved in cell wall biosynthesis
MEWLPIPSAVASADAGAAAAVRLKCVDEGRVLIGHFGSYGSAVATLLDERLPAIMDSSFAPSLLLLGAGSDRFREQLLARHPSWSARVHATGFVPPAALGAHIAACDAFVQPYPDGITSRRTSAMACLSQARPVVTTNGHLTEALWADTGAVLLAEVDDRAAFASAVSRLLSDAAARAELGRRGHQVYMERFSVRRVVDALRAA